MNLKIPQCWRFQQWGHFSKNCNRPFACVKCDISHAPGDCKFVSDDEVKPFCVNCKKRGHPSNFTGCPAFVKYCTIRNKQVQESKSRATLASTGSIAKTGFNNRVPEYCKTDTTTRGYFFGTTDRELYKELQIDSYG